jgi:8-oxo-dGTP diphosphatase
VPLRVVAGLIFEAGKVLACQRSKGGLFPMEWEFPGGKVEESEDDSTALRRELREELGIEVEAATEVMHYQYQYAAWKEVDLRFYRIEAYRGTIENRAFESLAWIEPQSLKQLVFLEGDRPIVDKLIAKKISG